MMCGVQLAQQHPAEITRRVMTATEHSSLDIHSYVADTVANAENAAADVQTLP